MPLNELQWDQSFCRDLPGDPETRVFPRQVRDAGWSAVQPTPVKAPRLLAWSREVAALLGITTPPDADGLAAVLGGNAVVPGMAPFATPYAGHQFGGFAGQLGDGRAISLGEVLAGEQRWEVQLKGAGPTPYSRRGDGRAVLRSSIREFLCSEAMHHLGVPTTRALSLVGTGDAVVRDILYAGDPRPEPGAVVARVAPSFLRFGHFELFAWREDTANLERLAAHTLARHFPELGEPGPKAYAAMLTEIARRTAVMVDHWMRVGFVHGVMNTDNMSVLGLTMDYGPYGWIDAFDADWTPNTTDARQGRYRFGQQASVALWNVVRLAEAFYPLVGEDVEVLRGAVDGYRTTFEARQKATFAAKLGLRSHQPSDDGLVEGLIERLNAAETDMTLFYRVLSGLTLEPRSDAAWLQPFEQVFYEPISAENQAAWAAWLRGWAQRAAEDGRPDADRQAAMKAANPKYVLRNYMAQQAIERAEQGELSEVGRLLEVMRRPYDEQPEHEAAYFKRRPEWARNKAGCSMLSCSS
jgi:uncharacterized protein YdiU (UPF0061 family)